MPEIFRSRNKSLSWEEHTMLSLGPDFQNCTPCDCHDTGDDSFASFPIFSFFVKIFRFSFDECSIRRLHRRIAFLVTRDRAEPALQNPLFQDPIKHTL